MIEAALERRRRDVAEAWDLREEVVLVGAGEPVAIPGRFDRTYPFRSHAEYLYLTDRERPGGVLAYDPEEGWVDFVVPVTREERLWEGARPSDGEGVPIDRLRGWMRARRGRPLAVLGAPLDPPGASSELAAGLRLDLAAVRRRKDAVELGRMRAAEAATRAGFAALPSVIHPGATEREVQIELESEFLRRGADGVAFDTIVGGGPNAAVLHFPPSRRPFADGELVLVDAGAECEGYVSDVTRTFAAGGSFTAEQAELRELVLAANRAGVAGCRPGAEFRDVHWAAARVIAEGLLDFGLLRGEVDGLVERRTVSLFFPHGVGHMVGLGVRDAGGAIRGREPADDFPRLRIDLPLEAGHVVTIEPGVYLVPALLQDPELRERHRDGVDWDRAERMLGFGGIRIEDNVLITHGEPEVLTAAIAH